MDFPSDFEYIDNYSRIEMHMSSELYLGLGIPVADSLVKCDSLVIQRYYDFFYINCILAHTWLSGIARGKLVKGILQATGKRRLYLYEI